MIQDNHESYRIALNNVKIGLNRDILWGQVLHSRIWECLENNLFQSIVYAMKSILINTYELKFKYSENKILIVRHCNNRADYNKMWNNLKLAINEFSSIEVKRNRKIDFNILYNTKKIIKIIKSMPSTIKFKDKIYLASWILRILRLESYDLSTIKGVKIAIFFFDGDPVENYLCQKIKLTTPNCITTTLQHGQYIYKKYDYDINQTGILNFISDYIFVWGKFTEKQFIKAGIDKKRVIKAGNLSNINGNALVEQYSKKYIFGVICDAPSYKFAKEKNNEMIKVAIKLARNLNMKVLIKLHPFDSEKNYTITDNIKDFVRFYSKDKLMSDFVKDIDFALLHVSSAYIDLLTLNCKSFKYNSDIDYPIVDNDEDLFNNYDELIEKINNWNKKSFKEQVKYLKFNKDKYIESGNTIEKYRLLINEMIL